MIYLKLSDKNITIFVLKNYRKIILILTNKLKNFEKSVHIINSVPLRSGGIKICLSKYIKFTKIILLKNHREWKI